MNSKQAFKKAHDYSKDKKGIVTKAEAIKRISKGLSKAQKSSMGESFNKHYKKK